MQKEPHPTDNLASRRDWYLILSVGLVLLPIFYLASIVATYTRESQFYTQATRDGRFVWQNQFRTRIIDRAKNEIRWLPRDHYLLSKTDALGREHLIEVLQNHYAFCIFENDPSPGHWGPWIIGHPFILDEKRILRLLIERGGDKLQVIDTKQTNEVLFEKIEHNGPIHLGRKHWVEQSKIFRNPMQTHLELFSIDSPEKPIATWDLVYFEDALLIEENLFIFLKSSKSNGAITAKDQPQNQRIEVRNLHSGDVERIIEHSGNVDRSFVSYVKSPEKIIFSERDQDLRKSRLVELIEGRTLLELDGSYDFYWASDDIISVRNKKEERFFQLSTNQLSRVWSFGSDRTKPINYLLLSPTEVAQTYPNGEMEIRDYTTGEVLTTYFDHKLEFPLRCMLVASILAWELVWLFLCRKNRAIPYPIAAGLAVACFAIPIWMRAKWSGIEEEWGVVSGGMVFGILTGCLAVGWCWLWVGRNQFLVRLQVFGVCLLACSGVVLHLLADRTLQFIAECVGMLMLMSPILGVARWRLWGIDHDSARKSSFHFSILNLFLIIGFVAFCIKISDYPRELAMHVRYEIKSILYYGKSALHVVTAMLAVCSLSWLWVIFAKRRRGLAILFAVFSTIVTAIFQSSHESVSTAFSAGWMGCYAAVFLVFGLHRR